MRGGISGGLWMVSQEVRGGRGECAGLSAEATLCLHPRHPLALTGGRPLALIPRPP